MSSRKKRQDLLTALNAAMREVSGQGVIFSQAVASKLKLNSTDLECLDFVVSRGAQTAGALAETTGLTTGAITGVIDRLERAGYVRREADANDRRKVLVCAVPAAIEGLMPFFAPMERAAMRSLAKYSDDELSFLLAFLREARTAGVAATAELRALPDNGKENRKKKR